MKLLLSAAVIAGVCLATLSTRAHATFRISLYSDAALSECTLSDASPSVINVYVAETSDEATGLQFRVAADPGFTGVWVSDSSPFFTIGNSQTDLSIGFGACMVGHFQVLTIRYQLFGTSTCSKLSIVATPGFAEPLCTACSFVEVRCSGYEALHVNCSGSFDCNPVPVEPSTWGSVKALYRD
jgi:hypothetical protein